MCFGFFFFFILWISLESSEQHIFLNRQQDILFYMQTNSELLGGFIFHLYIDQCALVSTVSLFR